MLNFKYISSSSLKPLTKINQYIINFIIISNLISIQVIVDDMKYLCDITVFNHSKFKAGNFAPNKNGELFIEYYSEDDKDISASRLFYARTKNGREIFFNESSST